MPHFSVDISEEDRKYTHLAQVIFPTVMSKKIPDLDSNDFIQILLILLRKDLFSFSYTQMTAKNPLFEVISLLIPTGPSFV
jgi:hypothetical protein